MSQAVARIVVRRGPNPNETFELIQSKITIGRSPANDIAITDPEVSRKHAQLVQQETGYALEDLGSTNGSFVNERRVVGLTPLHNGDVIELGEAISLVYMTGVPDEDATLVDSGSIVAVDKTAVEGMAPPDYQPPAYEPPAYEPSAYEPPSLPVYEAQQPVNMPVADSAANGRSASGSCRQRILLGCGGLILLLFLCTATIYFLDAYEQGRLLYCGPLQSFWELILGPFGFAPVCP